MDNHFHWTPETCHQHEYKTIYEDYEKETLECVNCGDRYTLWDDEMK